MAVLPQDVESRKKTLELSYYVCQNHSSPTSPPLRPLRSLRLNNSEKIVNYPTPII